MKRIKKNSIFLLLCLLLSPLSAQAAESVVRFNGDRLTLNAQNEELSKILGSLSEQGHPHPHRSAYQSENHGSVQ